MFLFIFCLQTVNQKQYINILAYSITFLNIYDIVIHIIYYFLLYSSPSITL